MTLPETFPLPTVTLEQARRWQFRLLECVSRHFDGHDLFSADLGVTPEWGRPRATHRVEEVLAEYFGAEGAALTQGAGTGAIRAMLTATAHTGDPVIVHAGPAYTTTSTTFAAMGLQPLTVDFDDHEALEVELARGRASLAHIQHARQRPGDRHDPADVVAACRRAGVRVLVDDNYTAFRVPRTGVELGADASAFSLFKLLGPEGVGAVVGTSRIVERVHADNYSGGGQVQGPQAMEALRALTHVPVLWAVQSEVVTEVAGRLAAGEVPGVAEVRVANAQDRCVLVRFTEPVARRVIPAAARHGAAPMPVGANSRYEVAPLFYRVSGSFLAGYPELADYTIRINPMRAGADLVVSILTRALDEARGEQRCS